MRQKENALKQVIKLSCKSKQYERIVSLYTLLLSYANAVTRNVAEKGINTVLDVLSSTSELKLMEQCYEITLKYLEKMNNERLWFKTNTKLAKLLLDRKELNKVSKIVKALRSACKDSQGIDDHQRKGTQWMEIYALETQLYSETKNYKKLKQVYDDFLKIKSAIPHPRIVGIIRECGGKMHMKMGKYEEAHKNFFEAFK
ncbi:hypothetical protein ROZALSC1DRAFT_30540, partial [Rozella allomycis CSF55]